jgi:putative redox protein
MEAKVIQIKGVTLMARADSNHWVTMDGSPEFGGQKAAPSPKELVLIGLGGCTANDVVSILAKMREPLQRFEIDLKAENAQEHPKVFTRIHMTYKFWGENLNQANLEKAIKLSREKYCSVSAMIEKSAEITHSCEINPA